MKQRKLKVEIYPNKDITTKNNYRKAIKTLFGPQCKISWNKEKIIVKNSETQAWTLEDN